MTFLLLRGSRCSTFPLQLGEWGGASSVMERQYLDALQLDNYVLADYSAGKKAPVNVYVAYLVSKERPIVSLAEAVHPGRRVGDHVLRNGELGSSIRNRSGSRCQ